jgi:chorismate synthase
MSDKDGEIASLQRNIEQLNHERDQTLSENHIGGVMGGISNLSEMEALVNFKEKEINQLRLDSEIKIQEYK